MAAHRVLFRVVHHMLEVCDGFDVLSLTQAVSQLVLEQGGGRRETSGDRFDGGDTVLCGRLQAGEVLEGEKSAESTSQGLRFRGQNLAQGRDSGIFGHFGRMWWGVEV